MLILRQFSGLNTGETISLVEIKRVLKSGFG